MDALEAKLIQEKLVDPMDLLAARQEAERYGKSVWPALVKLGYLSEEDVALFFSSMSTIPYIKVSDYKIDPEVLVLTDENFYRQNLIIPLFKVRNTVFVACANPLDTGLIDTLSQIGNCNIEPLLASARSVANALNSIFGPPQGDFEIEKFMIKNNSVKGLAFWRESERLPLKMPLRITVDDSAVVLNNIPAIDCWTTNVSRNGSAVGAQLPLFLPKEIFVCLEFNLSANNPSGNRAIKAKGEIVHSHMEKGQQYFLGIKFVEIDKNDIGELLRLASPA